LRAELRFQRRVSMTAPGLVVVVPVELFVH